MTVATASLATAPPNKTQTIFKFKQPQGPENDDSASGNDELANNQPENNGDNDAIENSEPTEENDTILDQSDPSENTSTIEK